MADLFERCLAAVKPTLVPFEPMTVAAWYCARHRAALFRSLDDLDVPIDHSATEREFQDVAKLCLACSPRRASRHRDAEYGPLTVPPPPEEQPATHLAT